MALDDFLEVTKTRIPTIAELVGLCDTLAIKFDVRDDGCPILRVTKGVNSREGELLANLFRREPFRSLVIGMRLVGREVAAKTQEPISRLELRYADGRSEFADETNRINEMPVACRWTGAEWDEIPKTL